MKNLLNDSKPPKDIPFTDEISIMKALRKTKITMSHVPGDLPPALRSEFFQWLTEPFKNIIVEIVTSREWPMARKVEYGNPIVKETPPVESEDSLRVISITNKLSMCAEQFVIRWAWPYLKDKIDRDQFGGITGNAVSHYLIELTNFVLYNQDKTTPLASIITLIDFSKGFNRIEHSKLLLDLADMGLPGWILRIITSYLENRSLIVRYKEGSSEPAALPVGVGQGTILGLWLFLIKMNKMASGGETDKKNW